MRRTCIVVFAVLAVSLTPFGAARADYCDTTPSAKPSDPQASVPGMLTVYVAADGGYAGAAAPDGTMVEAGTATPGGTGYFVRVYSGPLGYGVNKWDTAELMGESCYRIPRVLP